MALAVLIPRFDLGPTILQLAVITIPVVLMLGILYRYDVSPMWGGGAMCLAYIAVALPTVYMSGVNGIDIWSYLGTTEYIINHGWNPSAHLLDHNSNLFPGNQVLGAILVDVTGLGLFEMASIQPHLLKLSLLLSVFALGRAAGLSTKHSLIAPSLLVAYAKFVTWPPYHHITAGLSLKMLFAVTLVLYLRERGHPRHICLVAITFMGLLVSHQLSTIHAAVMLVLLLAISIAYLAASRIAVVDETSIVAPRRIAVLAAICGIPTAFYYITTGSLYFQFAFVNHLTETRESMTTGPDPYLVSHLELLPQYSIFQKLLSLQFNARKQYFPLLVVGLVGIAALALLAIRARRAGWSLQSQIQQLVRIHPLVYILLGWAGFLFMTRFFSFVGLGFWGGSPRLTIAAFPLAVVAFLLLRKQTSVPSGLRRALRPPTLAAIFIAILLSFSMFPTYALPGDALGFTHDRPVETSEQEIKSYEFVTQMTTDDIRISASDSEGFYTNGYARSDRIRAVRGAGPYAGRFDRLNRPDADSYLIWRDQFREFLPIRSYNRYAVPDRMHRQYGVWGNSVYTSGSTEVYLINDSE
ncbi:hypothetical protein JMJ58_14935 [Haloterrigena salifodinae]|uniref:Uncharacterized protein n=1 Tax=Haloterrigena salifodinae TaxID=2675099 RepID=A0A8T8DXG7_9EURY|nr:hypothetical protein [Haloterrigena salifodinae]QRV14229.1 hypothetical protein JMJ58_14935 [Haloterrigena salifodinae]